ncbi:OsmC family protein [Fimbriimonas ginsengisoli]|uniref:OsmC/Ohr family protein n=1 Tax=Fimbriimonas ginsengisoli Gsoil 348 TaxID=661478 RepID=A0A068NJ52_FIMGI|nr:OsmC family protein [Fimbriimonas ginsengisoli]AIE83618.1 OsmC/Ohr family protein [Fimbriimonas ginsengisoli Gsoil 348]
MLVVNWQGGMAFEADPPSGNRFVMDAIPEFGGEGKGPSPVEAFLASAAACSAMDVIGILEKKRQKVNGYRIEVEWQRDPPGTWPRPILSITVRHVLVGEGLDPDAVAKAVELSDTKYCTVIATLRQPPTVRSEYVVQEST